MNPITVKLSYSILSAWSEGRYEEAVGQYLGKPFPTTPQMELGRVMDEIWTNHILKERTLPQEFGGEPLVNSIVQQKYEKIIPMGERYQILLRGRPDIIDGEHEEICRDTKCGKTKPTDYVEKMQFPFYKLLKPSLRVGIYHCYNPYTRESSVGVQYLSDADAMKALEHIVTFGGEMISYLESNRLIQDYSFKS